ncbi:MAG: transcriptional regulator, AbrB family [Ignavibacteria bacterium]|nr:transcriptional regulator, AbrB family [Ignavibacteria bacterium]
MDSSTVSAKYNIVIPQEIRKNFNIKPGQKVRFIQYKNTIEIIPIVSMASMKGIFKGMDTSFVRDEEDRI